ncbi:DUF177 domain-containing protein [Candidatus Peregrinibacteria bacterium]|nr:DUF177 domain-containing protein [Candidatus Peregrinibacteria bacterium]
MLIFSVKNLLNQFTGAKEEYPLFETLAEIFPQEKSGIRLKSPLTGHLVLRKLPEHSVGVECYDVEISVLLSCSLCLKEYRERIFIDHFEGEFYLSPPQGREIAEQYFTIDKKKLEIDLSEIIRQTLLLHFPVFPVCSKSCKGLCPHCGKDLNTETCEDAHRLEKKENPFSILKEI